jgi:3-oxoacyl-[acyl-carrier protein] reductase
VSSPTSTGFEGQTAVVTGGTRGLGRAISLAFLASGALVRVVDRDIDAAAAALADAASPFGGRLVLDKLDVSDAEAVEAYWQRLERECPGGVQVLVNNAGIRRDQLLAAMKLEDWSAVIAANLTSGFLMSRQAVLCMLPRRYGRILFITSPAASRGFEGQANYAASKAGQVGMMRSLAREVARKGITVNCIAPGFVETELLAGLTAEALEKHKASVPMRRFGKPEEIAWAVTALAAREASYVTGATLEVAGGL